MKRKNFFSLLFLLGLFLVFLKIYQHNLLIKMAFEKQRLERQRLKLKDKRSLLLIKFFKLKNFKKIQQIAVDDLGLQELKLSQIKKVSEDRYALASDSFNI